MPTKTTANNGIAVCVEDFLRYCSIQVPNILEALVFLPSFNATLRAFNLATLHGSQNHQIGRKTALVQIRNIGIAFRVKLTIITFKT